MQISIRGGGRNLSGPFRSYAARRLLLTLSRFSPMNVNIQFENCRRHAPGSGVQCRLDVKLNASQAVTAEVVDKEPKGAFDRALERVRRSASLLTEILPPGDTVVVPVNGRLSAPLRRRS